MITTELAKFLGIPRTSQINETDVVLRLKTYIQENDLKDPVRRTQVNPDSKLRKLFGSTNSLSEFEMLLNSERLIGKSSQINSSCKTNLRINRSKRPSLPKKANTIHTKIKKKMILESDSGSDSDSESSDSSSSSSRSSSSSTSRNEYYNPIKIAKKINPTPKSKASVSKKSTKKTENNPEKPKKQSALTRPLKISSELLSFLGMSPGTLMSRVEVNKGLMSYVKENDLQNPEDRRLVIPDKKLNILLGYPDDKVRLVGMSKFLKRHFL